MNKKRGRLEVISEILSVSKETSTKTEICKKTNISFEMGEKYLNFLLGNNLIDFEDAQDEELENGYYFITDNGFEFLESFNKIRKLLSVI